MNYYVLDSNQEIALFDTSKSRLQTTLKFKPELAGATIEETEREIVELDGKFVFADEHTDELLVNAKTAKLKELVALTDRFEENKNNDMFFTSFLGFRVNGDRRTRSNIEDLIQFSDEFPVDYRDYDNKIEKVSKEDLQVMLGEHNTNGHNLYAQKWEYEQKIAAVKTVEEVEAIELVFEMMDFTKE